MATYRDHGDSIEKVFQRIEDAGGFPRGKPFLTMLHGVEPRQVCRFTAVVFRDEMNTTIASCDQYLWWLISGEYKERLTKAIVGAYKVRTAAVTRELSVSLDEVYVDDMVF